MDPPSKGRSSRTSGTLPPETVRGRGRGHLCTSRGPRRNFGHGLQDLRLRHPRVRLAHGHLDPPALGAMPYEEAYAAEERDLTRSRARPEVVIELRFGDASRSMLQRPCRGGRVACINLAEPLHYPSSAFQRARSGPSNACGDLVWCAHNTGKSSVCGVPGGLRKFRPGGIGPGRRNFAVCSAATYGADAATLWPAPPSLIWGASDTA